MNRATPALIPVLALAMAAAYPQTNSPEKSVQAIQPGFARVTGTQVHIQTAPNRSTFTRPDHYISRFDKTTVSTNYAKTPCVNSPLSTCDTPVSRIDFTNQETGMIPNLVGLEIDGWGFKSNTPSHDSKEVGMPYLVGLGVQMQDATVPNISNLRGANFVVDLSGLPTTLGSNGFTRSGVGIEVDVNPNAGVDAVFPGAVGNELDGISLVANGNRNSTAAVVVGTSATESHGWLDGLAISGVINCGICMYNGGARGVVAPRTAIHLAGGGAYGLVVGSGTITEPKSSASVSSNPAIGILLDAQGNSGAAAANNSNILAFRTMDVSGTSHDYQWQAVQSTGALTLAIDGREKVSFGSAVVAGYKVGGGAPTWSVSNQSGAASLGPTTIGNGGAAITRHLSAIASLNFGVIPAASCTSRPIAIAGAAEGDSVALGMAASVAQLPGVTFAGYVGAPGTVTVKLCNAANHPSPAAQGTVRADVWQH